MTAHRHRAASRASERRYQGPLVYLQYKLLHLLTLPTWGKVLLLVAVAVPIIGFFGYLLQRLEGGTWLEAARKTYYVLNNVPGTDVVNHEDGRVAFLLNTLYAIGLLTFAVMIGIFAEDIQAALEGVRRGNYDVAEVQHTLVLGSNRQLVKVLQQLRLRASSVPRAAGDTLPAERSGGLFTGPVVLLADQDKGQMDAMLTDQLGAEAAADIITRQGSPMKVCDLERVSAGRAGTVILLLPEQEQGGGALGLTVEAQQAVSLAALAQLRQEECDAAGGRARLQTIVVQQSAEDELPTMPPATLEGAQMVHVMSRLSNLGFLMGQAAVHPGVSAAMTAVMQQPEGAPEFYFKSVPEAVGRTYGEARRLFITATLCGYYCEGELCPGQTYRLVLNPPDDAIIRPDHSLVLLAETLGDTQPMDAPMPAPPPLPELAVCAPAPPPPLPSPPSAVAAAGAAAGAAATTPGDTPAILGCAAASNHQGQQLSPLDVLLEPQHAPPHGHQSNGNGDGSGHQNNGNGHGNGHGSAPSLPTAAACCSKPKHVVVLAFSPDMEQVLRPLMDFSVPGSRVTVVSTEPLACLETVSARGVAVCSVVADPRSLGALHAAHAASADAVVVAGLGAYDADLADAQTMSVLLQLQSLLDMHGTAAAAARRRHRLHLPHLHMHMPWGHGHQQQHQGHGNGSSSSSDTQPQAPAPLNMVCCINDPRQREVLVELTRLCNATPAHGGAPRRALTLDLINPDELLSGVLAQVAAEPRLSAVFEELLAPRGSEVYLRAPAAAGLPLGQELAWAQVQEAARQHRWTALGLASASSGELLLGLRADACVSIGPEDELVVLAEHWAEQQAAQQQHGRSSG